MRILYVIVVVAVFPVAAGANDDDGFHPLFNGKDLTGWVRTNTAPSTWVVKDEMIVCSGKPIGELRTDRMYQNFVLELEWRHMQPKGNAGVFIWADDITARGVPFHRGIEVQVLENAYGDTESHTTHGDIFPIHGAKMTPLNGRGGDRAFPTEQRSKPSPQWNHYRVTCVDGKISLAVNGKVVTRGENCTPRKGYICLESEGGIVHYRNLRIQELPETPVAAEHTAIADRGYRCLYTGIDLSGWKTSAKDHWRPNDWVLAYDGKASVADRAIATEESFGNFGFIFDVKFNESSKAARVLLRGSNDGAIAVDPNDALLAAHLAKSAGWNRFEGTLNGDKLTLTLNGHTLFTDKALGGIPKRGPITIEPEGPIDFANIYVRKVKGNKDS